MSTETQTASFYKLKQKTVAGIQMFAPVRPVEVFSGKYEKTGIVLHYTAGFFSGDLQTLVLAKDKVTTPYLIGRSGIIVELFDPALWAYHLGRKAVGGNITQSRRTIAIELTNLGWLDLKGDGNLYTYRGKKYCHISETEKYEKHKKWREKEHWCKFTDEQYDALNLLLPYLSERFNIPLDKIGEDGKRHHLNQSAQDFEGIMTHSNFRLDKWDIGPAFDWDRI